MFRCSDVGPSPVTMVKSLWHKKPPGFISVFGQTWLLAFSWSLPSLWPRFQAGHPFQQRCAQSAYSNSKPRQEAPVFLLFLDCVWQILRQFPCSFEFNENFLVQLFEHAYASQFGTFMGNSAAERSVWVCSGCCQSYAHYIYTVVIYCSRPILSLYMLISFYFTSLHATYLYLYLFYLNILSIFFLN